MESTFVTGVELVNQPQAYESKPKQEEKVPMPSLLKGFSTKHTRSSTAIGKSVPPIKDSFPQINNREPAVKSSRGLRSSASEANLNKPLFKKLVEVREEFEKNKPGYQTERTKPIVFPREKREGTGHKSYTHADAFNQTIIQKFDKLYQSRKNLMNNKQEENLTKRKHLFDEIEKQETKVQSEQKKYNNLAYDITKSEKVLEKLQYQVKELDKQIEDNTALEEVLWVKEREFAESLVKIELEEHNNTCLKHMRHLKKELLLSLKKKYVLQQDKFTQHEEGIERYLKELKEAKRLIKKGKYNIHDIKTNKLGAKENLIDPEFEELLENEISEFEERRNLREILKHEKVIEEELRMQQIEEERRIAFSKENKLREEENRRLQKEAEHEKELNKIKKQYYEFQKVTHVARKDQLIEYYDGLEEKGEVLLKEIDAMNDNIRDKKEELEALQKQLKYKKFEEAKEPKDNFPQDIRIEDLEALLRDKLNDAIDRENNTKKSEKLSYEVCTVISRILKQLQKSKAPMSVDKNNVVDLLSICGLKLERMLTVVIKKRKTFFIESINTDGTIKEGPPAYMNLVSDDVYNKSRKRFEKETPVGIEEELDDGVDV